MTDVFSFRLFCIAFTYFVELHAVWYPGYQSLKIWMKGKERRKKGVFLSFFIFFYLLFFGSGTQGSSVDWSRGGGYFTINSYGGVRRKDFCYDPIPEI